MNRFRITAGLLITILAATVEGSIAQTAPSATTPAEPQSDMTAEIELTRAVIQVKRQAIVTQAMDLEPKESEAFWPLYREYRVEVAKVNDRRVKLIATYMENYEALSDGTWFVRLQAARALGAIAHPRAIAPLVSALTDEYWQVRAAAADALRRLGNLAVPALTHCLFTSRDRYAKEQIVEELQRTSLIQEQIDALDEARPGAGFAAQRLVRDDDRGPRQRGRRDAIEHQGHDDKREQHDARGADASPLGASIGSSLAHVESACREHLMELTVDSCALFS